MSEQDDSGTRWWLVALGALAVLALGVGLGNGIRTKDDPPTPAESTAAASPEADVTTPPLVVTAGQGGSSKAVDGKTQVGYQNNCEGAVAAATNYVSSATRLEWVKSYGDKLLDQIADADSQRIEYHRKGMRTALNGGITMESHPEWGGFRLVACDSHDATINVWECEIQRYQGQAQRSCTVIATAVSWVNGDWKLRRYEVPADPPTPEAGPDPVPGEQLLPAAERRRALQTAGAGWQEYANAPQ